MHPRFLLPTAAAGALRELDPDESRRARVVLRLPDGAPIEVFDGRGAAWAATVEPGPPGEPVAVRCTVPVAAPEPKLRLTVGAAIPKGDGMTPLVRQLAELGVDRVTPLETIRSEGSGRRSRLRRWHAAALSGVRQCGGALVPVIEPPTPFPEWLESMLPAIRWIAIPGERGPAARPATVAAAIAIGPEGGFTLSEVDAARKAGFRRFGLGDRVLRIGTAAVVSAARLLGRA